MKTKLLILVAMLFTIISCNPFKSESDSINLIPYKSGDKWGYIDKNGKILINPQFEEANIFIEGIALVKSANDKYGYISEDGKYKINASYKKATFFSEGLACVVPENGRPQFIDEDGNVKFTVSTGELCGLFSDDLAAVKVAEKWGYLDKKGNIKINTQFDYAFPFNDGLASVTMLNKDKGETLYGYINTEGKIIINYQFKFAGRFVDGIALVSDGKKYGYIDNKGKYIVNPQFDAAGEFKNGLAIIVQGSMFGYIDKEGKIVINPQFKRASTFSNNGTALVWSSDSRVGYIDKEGKYTINPQFEFGTNFFDDIAFVRSGDKWGIINKEGKYLINPQYDNFNVDIDSYKYQTIESDYFDISGIVDKFLEGTDQKTFRKLSANTTVKDLKNFFPDLNINDYSWSAQATDHIAISQDNYIINMEFTFNEVPVLENKPVYKTEIKNDYFKGNYKAQVIDHYENILNDKSNLKEAKFIISLNSSKSREKWNQIYNALKDAIVTRTSFKPSASANDFSNEYMSMNISGSSEQIIIFTQLSKNNNSSMN
jgi:hypothetical protein